MKVGRYGVGGWGRADWRQMDVEVEETFPLSWPEAALLVRSFLCLTENTGRFNSNCRLSNLCMRRILKSPRGRLSEAEICGTGPATALRQFFCPSCT